MLQSALVRDVFTHIAEFFGTSRVLVVEQVFRVAVVWVVAWLAYQLVKRVARRIMVAVDDGDDSTMTAAEKRGHTVAQLVRSVGRVVVLAIAGFFILVENQFAVGDVIEAVGKSGTVERMTLRVAVLRDIRGVLQVIPNGQITTVSNLTRSWSRAVVEVGVGYDTDVDRAIAVFKDELAQFQSDPAWKSRFAGDSDVLGIEQPGEHSVVIRTLLRTVPGAQWDVAREFRRRIKNRLDAEQIEMPFPQRTVHLRHHATDSEVPADQL